MRFAVALLAIIATLPIGSAEAKPKPRYLYYLHGKIVEDLGPRGINPRYGAYDYPGIIAALSAKGLTVVSEIRPKNTDPRDYAERIVAEITTKLRGGVPASRITVAGASKGAVIAALISTRLAKAGVRYVLLADCNDWLIREMNPHLSGEILSIYEASDDIGGTCKPLVRRSPAVTRFSEIRLTTGLRHGFIYRALPAWIEPAARWAMR